jgi:succinate dehydrogenase / fumarate reductase, membrane anchor subunit
MKLRAPLAQVRGVGSAKSGAHHWWGQRLTAVALVPLVLWFVVSMSCAATADYATAAAWLQSPINAGLLLFLVVATFHHGQLGMQVVLEDYVHVEWMKIAGIVLVKFAAVVLALISIVAILRVALGG